jgi:RecA-family ATPase
MRTIGKPKAGKTTLMRQAAEAVGDGGEFLESQSEQADVVFVRLEEG